jgi:hypothetical protein
MKYACFRHPAHGVALKAVARCVGPRRREADAICSDACTSLPRVGVLDSGVGPSASACVCLACVWARGRGTKGEARGRVRALPSFPEKRAREWERRVRRHADTQGAIETDGRRERGERNTEKDRRRDAAGGGGGGGKQRKQRWGERTRRPAKEAGGRRPEVLAPLGKKARRPRSRSSRLRRQDARESTRQQQPSVGAEDCATGSYAGAPARVYVSPEAGEGRVSSSAAAADIGPCRRR